jgi:Protein of unknown function (DUF3078)
MKNGLLTIALLFLASITFAQDNEKTGLEKAKKAAEKAADTTNLGWKRSGNFIFLLNQSAFNNEWLGGGTSSIAGNIGLNYDYNYSSVKSVWDNKLIVAYGLTKQKDQDMTKSDDRIEFTSLYGKKSGNSNWYYSAFLNFKTQMDSGTDAVTGGKISHFFSPAYLQVGPGMLWKKSDNLKVNIAPATSRIIFVHKEFTAGLPDGVTYYGVEGNKTTRFEFGAAVNAYYKATLMANVTMENILNLYSNYLENPQNVDIDYQMNLVMKVNKYISANIAFQAIYDDNAVKAVQVRQVFGLGINYGF